MAYLVRWGNKRFYTSSEYEVIRKKNELRRKGETYTVEVTGKEKSSLKHEAENKRYERIRKIGGEASPKAHIAEFIKICSNVKIPIKK